MGVFFIFYILKLLFICIRSFFMNLFFYTFLFIFWTMFGSFASVVIYRIKSGEGGIFAGRSHCKTCERDLSALELIPLFSWLFQWWKCAGCKEKISAIYPILELSTWILFTLVWIFLISPELIFTGDIFEWSRMLFFLWIMFLSIIYIFYDILYLEIPESILLIANISVLGILILQDLGWRFIPYMGSWNSFSIETFSLCLVSLGLLYYIMLWGLKEIYDCLILTWIWWVLVWYVSITWGLSGLLLDSALLSGTLAAFAVFISFFIQIVLSGGRAMGAGDLRIAILMWLLVGSFFVIPAWMICYLVGSIVWIFLVAKTKIMKGFKAPIQHEVPFGPFIAAWYLAVVFFAPQISSFIAWYF